MKIYDFTIVIHPELNALWPGHPKPVIEVFKTYEDEQYEARIFKLDSHAGTHIDAPKHIVRGRKSVDEFPIEKYVGEGVILEMERGPYEEISDKDLINARPAIKEEDIVLLHTGWGQKWIDNWDEETFKGRPGITTRAAEWLASKKIKVVGIDNLTISSGKAEELNPGMPSVHRILCSNDVIIVEGLVNLKQAAGQRGIIAVGVIPIKGADGGQARVFAIMP